MKISSILRDFLAFGAGPADSRDPAWRYDPYAHPDVRAMTERERADLPPFHAFPTQRPPVRRAR